MNQSEVEIFGKEINNVKQCNILQTKNHPILTITKFTNYEIV